MRTMNSFGIHFILRMNKVKNGKAPIYVRISVNGERIEMSLRQSIKLDDWNNVKGLAKPKTQELKELNNYLEKNRGKLSNIYQELVTSKALVSATQVKNKYLGIEEQQNTLSSLMDYHNTNMKEVLAHGTLKNYFTTEKYLKKFLIKKYSKKDIYLSELSYEFLTNFEYFLRKYEPIDHHRGMANNGVMKHLERFRKMVRLSVKLGWLEKNPFEMFQLKMQKVERGYLDKAELLEIENKHIDIPRIRFARDLFVFSCYTGMSYIDVMQLKPSHIVKGIDGNYWIKTLREKTDTLVNVPLLPKALEIVEQYRSNSRSLASGTIFPVISNQKLNSYLKEIADICGIKKNLTFHLARHTFATSVTLSNGVPIETVSKMLGHTSIRTTQIYAKVVEHKVSFDMETLKNKLESEKQLTKSHSI
ncbi:site-specific integrase [Pedobacter puniceum]|uniref:Tyrosine-type recombinase/integrase n=1 Tax=Pedobacter puniceum TaxID=2666136 RepID=A0A7K0FLX7_9SPHI|nr:site-specific integrase [Pedobacter puniceum]MRX46969.1 tyrosine-type recombinase/integrase [Pedobacter puniceum]